MPSPRWPGDPVKTRQVFGLRHLVKEKDSKKHSKEFGFLPEGREGTLRQESVKNRQEGVR